MSQNTIQLKITKNEYDLLIYMREKLPYGSFRVITYGGHPVRITDIIQSIPLGLMDTKRTGEILEKEDTS